MILLWLQFIMAALVIVMAGFKITDYADSISDRTGIGRGFIGVLLLGMATSMPEVVTSVSSVVMFKAADMAVGNLLGSCTFNLLIVVVIDFLFKIGSAEKSSILTGWLSVIMILLVGIGYILSDSLPSFYLHPVSFVILIGYFVSLYKIFIMEKRELEARPTGETPETVHDSLLLLLLKTGIAGLFLIFSSIWLSSICDQIAEVTGWNGTVIGAFFMAVATSLPELVVSITALKMGQLGLSLGNIYGSNIFNIGILSLVDIAYGRKGVFSEVTLEHVALAFIAIMMSIVLLTGFKKVPKRRIARMQPVSLVVFIIYIAGFVILFYNGT